MKKLPKLFFKFFSNFFFRKIFSTKIFSKNLFLKNFFYANFFLKVFLLKNFFYENFFLQIFFWWNFFSTNFFLVKFFFYRIFFGENFSFHKNISAKIFFTIFPRIYFVFVVCEIMYFANFFIRNFAYCEFSLFGNFGVRKKKLLIFFRFFFSAMNVNTKFENVSFLKKSKIFSDRTFGFLYSESKSTWKVPPDIWNKKLFVCIKAITDFSVIWFSCHKVADSSQNWTKF